MDVNQLLKKEKKEINNNIQGIIFDLGGVLMESAGDESINYICKILGVEQDRLKKIISKEIIPLEKGKEASLDFWHRICNKLKISYPSDKILESLWVKPYKDHAEVRSDMFDLVKKLEEKYKLAILSNTIKDHSQINKKRKLFDCFDEVLLSNEVGFIKPEEDFFRQASKRLKISFENLVFIDDEVKWVRAARKYGLKAILFNNKTQLEVKLKRLGVY